MSQHGEHADPELFTMTDHPRPKRVDWPARGMWLAILLAILAAVVPVVLYLQGQAATHRAEAAEARADRATDRVEALLTAEQRNAERRGYPPITPPAPEVRDRELDYDEIARIVAGLLPTPRAGQPGAAGRTGATGPPGTPGVSGSSPPCLGAPTRCVGPSGQDGAPGAPGKDGQDGKDGAPGKDGKDGSPPASWTWTWTDALGRQRVVTCSPAAEFDPDQPRYTCTEA